MDRASLEKGKYNIYKLHLLSKIIWSRSPQQLLTDSVLIWLTVHWNSNSKISYSEFQQLNTSYFQLLLLVFTAEGALQVRQFTEWVTLSCLQRCTKVSETNYFSWLCLRLWRWWTHCRGINDALDYSTLKLHTGNTPQQASVDHWWSVCQAVTQDWLSPRNQNNFFFSWRH